jgi:pyridoxine 5-phosphate synthase
MIRLGVNIDHVATLRQARGTRYPEPVAAALSAQQAGADGITAHLREDRRHIQDRDIHVLKDVLAIPLNLEMAVTEEMLRIAATVRPTYCCLVPERREELTTEGGLNIVGQLSRITDACQRLNELGIIVSLFIDADPAQVTAAATTGAAFIEIHTGRYAEASDPSVCARELEDIAAGVAQARGLGLRVNAGHGLNYHNVQAVAAIPAIEELNIGHAIIAQAVFSGMAAAVREMKRLMREAGD